MRLGLMAGGASLVLAACGPAPGPTPVAPSACSPSSVELVDVAAAPGQRHVCDLRLTFMPDGPPARVALDASSTPDRLVETLSVSWPDDDRRQVWQTRATFDRQTGGDQFRQVLALTTATDTTRLAYSVVHCAGACLGADLVVLADDGETLREVFRSDRLSAATVVAAPAPDALDVAEPVFRPGDMCCPGGLETTHLTWDGSTYIRKEP